MRVLIVLLFYATVFLQADQILDKKIEILKMMAEDNISQTSKPLMYLTQDSDKKTRQKALNIAACQGNAEALRLIGYQKFKDQREEGLILLCESAILGDRDTIRDLHIMPKLMKVTSIDIERSCTKAMQRLRNGRTVINQKRYISSKDFNDKLDYFEFIKNKKGLNYISCIHYLSKNVDIYSLQGYQIFLNEMLEKDMPRIAKKRRLQQEAKIRISVKGEEKAILQRNQNRNDASLKLLKEGGMDDLKQFNADIEKQLLLINKHRSLKRQISSKNLWMIIGETK